METKICKKCNNILALSAFASDKSSKDGCYYICKACKKEGDAARNFPVTNLDQVCTKCETLKPPSEFYRDKSGPNGISTACRSCCAAIQKAITNPVSVDIKTCTKCLLTKPAEDFAKARVASDGLMYQCKACMLLYRLAHKAEKYIQDRNYYKRTYTERRHLYTAACTKRNAYKLSATPAWAEQAQIQEFYKESRRLTDETGISHNVDHIVPLQHPLVCGLHTPDNLQVLTRQENQQKHNFFEPGFYPILWDYLPRPIISTQ